MKKLSALVGFIFFLPIFAFADPWVGYSKISYLYPTSAGYAFLLQVSLPERSLCDEGRRFSIPLSHPNYNAMVSSLMMAFASGKSIKINLVTGEAPTCSPSVDRFFIMQE